MEVFSQYQENLFNLRKRIDRFFGWLMVGQWIFTVVLAWIQSGYTISTYLGMIALTGATITMISIALVLKQSGHWVGGYIMATAQIGYCTLINFILDGQNETQFYFYISLLMLSSYRNWRLVAYATTMIIIGTAWQRPEFIPWTTFGALVLGYFCFQAMSEFKLYAETQAELVQERSHRDSLNDRRTQFFSVISHEIRTPLNGIIGFADLLKESPIPLEQKEYASIIKQCSDTLLKLVNDLLDFSRIESGKLDLDPHIYKTKDIENYLNNIFSLECKKKNLLLHFEIAENVPNELFGDSHRIRQVLSNLVGNAVKFTENGGVKIKLHSACPMNSIYRWTVEDSGIGIHQDYLAKIFSPYTQEFSSTSRRYGGSGLGLAISKKLVELMGGQLEVESTVGKGTVFSFTTPISK